MGAASQGIAVALSRDGNTALIGGPYDNSGAGAAWIFVRSGGTWTPQAKLVGKPAFGASHQGWSVALSADGNTALVGAPNDNNSAGAAWVFTRQEQVLWFQQYRLAGSGGTGPQQEQGYSVALSADGNTALVGGPLDATSTGAVWVFTGHANWLGSGLWRQQGPELVGTNPSGFAVQGSAVALSADGNTALVGGLADPLTTGATWVFTRSAGVWAQRGNKPVGTGEIGEGGQGESLALSGDGGITVQVTDSAGDNRQSQLYGYSPVRATLTS